MVERRKRLIVEVDVAGETRRRRKSGRRSHVGETLIGPIYAGRRRDGEQPLAAGGTEAGEGGEEEKKAEEADDDDEV